VFISCGIEEIDALVGLGVIVGIVDVDVGVGLGV